jgi:hypothetical protein
VEGSALRYAFNPMSMRDGFVVIGDFILKIVHGTRNAITFHLQLFDLFDLLGFLEILLDFGQNNP